MKRIKGLLAIPAIIASGACAPPPAANHAPAYYDAASAGNACWIEFIEISGQSVLEVFAAPGLEGSYELDVRQSSGGGSAVISQSGPFSSAGDVPERISQITLGGNPSMRGAPLSQMMASMRSAEPGTTVISSGRAGVYDVSVRLLDRRGRPLCTAERSGP